MAAIIFEFNGSDVLDTRAEVAGNFADDRSAVLTATTLFCVASVLYLAFLIGLVAFLHRVEASGH